MKNKAFTLVEIMIVVVIIGLLAAMLIPAIEKIRGNIKYDVSYKVTHYIDNNNANVYYVKREPYWPSDATALKLHQDDGTTITISGNIKIEEVRRKK